MVEPPGNVCSGGWLATSDFDQIVETPVACLAKNRFSTVVEFARIELVSVLLKIDLTPARERPGSLAQRRARCIDPRPVRKARETLDPGFRWAGPSYF